MLKRVFMDIEEIGDILKKNSLGWYKYSFFFKEHLRFFTRLSAFFPYSHFRVRTDLVWPFEAVEVHSAVTVVSTLTRMAMVEVTCGLTR